MPKLIDYPRTSYTGAWELAEITDDTGGKCTIETAARKLNRKVSGSFKAIIGSAVKFGLITSKRELLTTTTLFKRIKHAYDKQEELAFHREAFLTPPLFTQICRKFRSRELPVQMLDVMLIREFGVEEINAQGVAKAFVDGCRMVGLLDEHNTVADIDAFTKQSPRQQLASPIPRLNQFRPENQSSPDGITAEEVHPRESERIPSPENTASELRTTLDLSLKTNRARPIATAYETANRDGDAIATLFGFTNDARQPTEIPEKEAKPEEQQFNDSTHTLHTGATASDHSLSEMQPGIIQSPMLALTTNPVYQVQISGTGINTILAITEEEDISLAIALLEKIRRQINSRI